MAYRRGLLTIQECYQILGIESKHLLGEKEDHDQTELFNHSSRHTISG